MNRINFVKPVPSSTKKEVRLWNWLCLSLGSLLFLNISIISGMQWFLYRALQKQKNELYAQLPQFNAIMTDQRTKLIERDQLQKQLDATTRYKTNPKNPMGIFAILRKATQDMEIQMASISKKQFELHMLCPMAAQAAMCIKRLNESPGLQNVTLASLQTHHDKVQATIKGTITTKLRE